MTKILNHSQSVEAMVEHVRMNLLLENKKEHQQRKSTLTFEGRGISEKSKRFSFALEAVIATDSAISESNFKQTVMERVSRQDRMFTVFLFPKSIDSCCGSSILEQPTQNFALSFIFFPRFSGQPHDHPAFALRRRRIL